MKKLKLPIIILSLMFFAIIRLCIFRYIPIEGLGTSSPFIADLLGKGFDIPFWLIMFSDIFNLILFWLIGEKILGKRFGFLVSIYYAISPWPAYLTINGSIFILVLFGLLLFYLGLTLVKMGRNFFGISLALLGLGIMIYSNFSILFVLPFLFLAIYKNIIFTKENRKIVLTVLVFMLLPIVLFSALNRDSIKQIIAKNVSLFNEVGLINSVNMFRGEMKDVGQPHLGVLVENKITYLGRHVLFNTLTAFSPFTYFTQQFKLLGFSFTPPIFLGLLIPFLYGLILMFRRGIKRYYPFLLTLPLLIPAILHSYFPDLSSLVLILPTILFISAWGMEGLIQNKKWLFVMITVCLIFLQGATTLYDIATREPIRYQETIRTN